MEHKASTMRVDLQKMLVDETAEPKALALSLLEEITGDFSEDQEIGHGGFAVVYKGKLGDRAVAVKKLSDAFMYEKEFHREVECLMRVKHKNVVRFLGYCADRQGNVASYEGKFVMADVHNRLLCFEYASKGSLDKYIKDARPEWQTCYNIIKGICEGLQHLHENHIIHLDLKPANILLDDNTVPKIADFGLSRCFDKSQSRDITKTLLGTMGYFAPEHNEKGVISCSTDLYSLGVIIIEILTGQKGHQDTEDVLQGWSDRLEGSQRDTLCQQIRICYEAALECVKFNPKKRPASVQDIIDRLDEMESIQTGEAAFPTAAVAERGAAADPAPGDDRHEAFAAVPSDPVASTSAAESNGNSKDEPQVFRSVSASSEGRDAMLHAMAAPGQTVVNPRPPGIAKADPRLPARLGVAMAATRMASTYEYDMVEPMSFLYVSVVKARDLWTMDITRVPDPYVEVKLGNFKGVTPHPGKTHNPVWRQKFAFSLAHVQSDQLEVIVKDKDTLRNDLDGRVVFDVSDIPGGLPPDNQPAPQWYTLLDPDGFWHGHDLGEIMLAVWFGTQADEAFPEAWHSDAHSLSEEGLTNARSTVYYSPKLMYLKVEVIAVIAVEKGRSIQPAIAAMQLGSQIVRTGPGQPREWANQTWNEEFMFVASEPFEDPLVVTVEEMVATGADHPIGRIIIPVASYVPRNDLAKSVPPKWFELHVHDALVCKIRLKMSLETSYHVLESNDYSSDLLPAANKLRKSAIGFLKVGILSARGLGGNKNPYCVAKYGAKWVRTRTLLGAVSPAWNEQYTWEVFDLSTALVVAVFDNNHVYHGEGGNDQRIGKVRFRLTTLESDRVYTHHYPLMALSPGGLEKMGELTLAVRFTCMARVSMLTQYGWPLMPRMHYTNPVSVPLQDHLRFQAMQMVAARLGRAEPPLPREVVGYMLDVNSRMFSLRRSKANFNRISSLFSGVVAVAKWFDGICKWKNPLTTILVHVGFLKLVCSPELILPTVFLCLILTMAWNYRRRPWGPPHIDTVLSRVEHANTDVLDLDEESDILQPPHIDAMMWWYTDMAYPDELDEEFDTLSTSKADDIVRLRYDRLRNLATMVQTVAGDLATQGERAQSLLDWGDPRVTPVFIALSLAVAVVLYRMTPFRVVAMVMVLYFLRPPWLRGRTNLLLNLYTRLPSKNDMML